MSTVDLELLKQYAERRLISTQRHPRFPLLIHNYAAQCQYDRVWDDVTMQCRGLITDLSGNIIARPFRKFFNLEEHSQDFGLPRINWSQPFHATKKMDGSLGILYDAGGEPCIATRGSFLSGQAQRATAILRHKGYARYAFRPDRTYLFEIIYPENRIVVDYCGMEELVLIDIIDTDSGESAMGDEAPRIGCPVVEQIAVDGQAGLIDYISGAGKNEEGLVVLFADGTRVKLKCDEYKRLHKLITGINSRHIWERLATGESFEELLAVVPDEFYGWVQATRAEITNRRDTFRSAADALFSETVERLGQAERKAYAMEFLKHRELSAVLFRMLDGGDAADLLWKMSKPERSVPFMEETEAA